MQKCAPIDLHYKMCSHWLVRKNVLLTAKFQSQTSLLQRNILSLSYRTKSAFDFTS